MPPREADSRSVVDRVKVVRERSAASLWAFPNVTGLGVGYKIVGGVRTDVICIRVYVTRKIPRQALRSDELLPEAIEGIPVDVIEARFQALSGTGVPPIQEHRVRHNPLIGGISVTNVTQGGSGTIGVSVFDNTSREDMILSNWHVLCQRSGCQAGEGIIQPGQGGGDGGTANDIVGYLHRAALTSEVDAAIARLSGHRFLEKKNLGIGSVLDAGTHSLGMRVRKSGRTTGVTAAHVTDESASVFVDYPDGRRLFVNQIMIENGSQVAQRGDSGSVWVDDANRAVGLLFAGSNGLGVANPISAVMQALGVNLRSGMTMHEFVASLHVSLF